MTNTTNKAENGLAKELVSVVKDTADSAKDVKDFVLSQAPDVVQQLLRWELMYSLINFTIILILIAFCIYLCRWVNLNMEKNSDYMAKKTLLNGGFFILIIFMLSILSENLNWLQILIAPKVYLIEYAAALAK